MNCRLNKRLCDVTTDTTAKVKRDVTATTRDHNVTSMKSLVVSHLQVIQNEQHFSRLAFTCEYKCMYIYIETKVSKAKKSQTRNKKKTRYKVTLYPSTKTLQRGLSPQTSSSYAPPSSCSLGSHLNIYV